MPCMYETPNLTAGTRCYPPSPASYASVSPSFQAQTLNQLAPKIYWGDTKGKVIILKYSNNLRKMIIQYFPKFYYMIFSLVDTNHLLTYIHALACKLDNWDAMEIIREVRDTCIAKSQILSLAPHSSQDYQCRPNDHLQHWA